jgi:hypothetical protein
METLYNIDAAIENEANQGIVNLSNAFGQLVGQLDVSYPSTAYPPLAGLELTSDYEDEFDSMADSDGNFVLYVPVGDPAFDYSNAELSAVDPLSGDEAIGSAEMNLNNINSQSPMTAPTVTGTCIDDDANDPDSDDPDCDNLG